MESRWKITFDPLKRKFYIFPYLKEIISDRVILLFSMNFPKLTLLDGEN